MPLTVRRNSPLDRKICLLAYTENPKGCGGRLVDESRGGQGEQTDDTLSNLFICPDPQQKMAAHGGRLECGRPPPARIMARGSRSVWSGAFFAADARVRACVSRIFPIRSLCSPQGV